MNSEDCGDICNELSNIEAALNRINEKLERAIIILGEVNENKKSN